MVSIRLVHDALEMTSTYANDPKCKTETNLRWNGRQGTPMTLLWIMWRSLEYVYYHIFSRHQVLRPLGWLCCEQKVVANRDHHPWQTIMARVNAPSIPSSRTQNHDWCSIAALANEDSCSVHLRQSLLGRDIRPDLQFVPAGRHTDAEDVAIMMIL